MVEQPDHDAPSEAEGQEALDLDLDLSVLKSLAAITHGDLLAFEEVREPPASVKNRIADADIATVNGILMHTLRRWHHLGAYRKDHDLAANESPTVTVASRSGLPVAK
ncbi:MAG: hypothetical protein AAF266_10940 [Planctomycetota bacterium]